MKRVLLAFVLLTGCGTASTIQRPSCEAVVIDETVRDAAKRALTVITSGVSKELIVNNLETIARDVGPDAFNCAMEYLRGCL